MIELHRVYDARDTTTTNVYARRTKYGYDYCSVKL